MQQFNLEQINKILNHAHTTVPFYMNDKWKPVSSYKEFRQIPLLEKSTVQNNPDAFKSNDHFHSAKMKDLIIHCTSGSTGKYLKVYWNIFETMRALSPLWMARKKNYNINPEDKYCYFYTTEFRGNRIQKEKEKKGWNERILGFCKSNLDNEKIKDIIKQLNEFQPKWLLLQPCMAELLLDSIDRHGIKMTDSIQYIEFTGEFLNSDLITRVIDIFKCSVSNQYGSNETSTIAYSCEYGHLHIFSANNFVEVLSNGEPVNEDKVGDIYLTSLKNTAMPFIRYKIGDRGKLIISQKCLCGNKTSYVELTAARESDYILSENGEKINPYIFLRPVQMINEKAGRIIKQSQIIQNNINDFTVKLAINKSYWGWRETLKNEFQNNISQDSLSSALWDFKFYENLFPDAKSGKLKYFINKLNSLEVLNE